MKSRYLFDSVSKIDNPKIWTVFNNMKSGSYIGVHDHDFLELVIIQDGLGWHLCGEEKFHISAGNVFMIPLGVKHGYRSVDNLKLYSVLFYPEILRQVNDDLNTMPGFQMLFNIEPKMLPDRRMRGNLRISENILPEILKKLDGMFAEQESRLPGFQTVLTVNFLEIVLLASRNCHTADDKYYHHASKISCVISFMESHYNEELTLDSLARLSGLSLGTFRRRFQEAAGMPPIAYLLKLRMHKAALLLRNGNLNITEIANLCGFPDSNYFSHQFRKFFKVSPSGYQKRQLE